MAGILFGYLFVRTGNVLYPMALHVIFNMISGVYTSEMLKRITDITDENGSLMTLELAAPNQRQAVRLCKLFEGKSELIYNMVMAELLDDEEEIDS